MAALGQAAVLLFLGWAVASYFITSAILGKTEKEKSDMGFFESAGYGIKFFIVMMIILMVPFWLISTMLK